MGTVRVNIQYLRSTASGFYWEPSRKLKAQGFAAEALGKDPAKAFARAKALNEAAKAKPVGPIASSHVREGTVAWLIRIWQRSPGWAQLSDASRRSYGTALRIIEDWCGEFEPRAVTRKAIKAWQRSLETGRGQAMANNILLRLHRLMEMARDEGLIDHNPASRLGLRKTGGNQEPWSRDEIDRVCAAAVAMGRPSIRLAVLLAANLGQREADIIKLSRSRYDSAAGIFDIRQQKTKRRIGLPATLELRAAIDAAPAVSPVFVISEETRLPYKETNFQAVFRRICRAAGIPEDRKFMHLRHTMATLLGEAGCTDEEIRSVTGHADSQTVARYARPNTTMATNAIAKLEKMTADFPSRSRNPHKP